jgi:hypothetical protein
MFNHAFPLVSKETDLGCQIILFSQDSTVPELSPELPTPDNTMGIDILDGVNYYILWVKAVMLD